MVTANLNQKFLSGAGQVSIDITAPDTQPDVLAAFANNTAFPNRQINLGSISAKASAGTDKIKFGDGAGQVTFSGSASAFAGLGAYPDPAKLLNDLKLEGDLAPGLKLPSDPNSLYLVLRWGYDLAASAKGAIALGAPLTFSFSGKREALYAVIRQLPKAEPAPGAVKKVATSWMLPKQVSKLDDLEPGTWLIAEVDGSIGGSLGIKYGYDFNWVHEAKLMGLSGDIGLKLKLGVEAALGFNIASSFGLVVARESLDPNDKFLRVRLFRLKRKGWTFAFDAGASVTGNVKKFLPEFDEFIEAIFGVHGGQVLSELKKWTDSNVTLGQLLSGEAVDFSKEFLEEVTGINPETAFDNAIERISGFIDLWNDLPHRVSSSIWKFVEKKIDLAPIRELAGQIEDANEGTFNALITRLAGDIDFLRSPAGEWLQQAAAKGLVELLNSSQEFKKIQEIAEKTRELLDGSTLESVLEKLQDYVEKHLNLNQLFPGFAKLEDIIGAGSIQDLGQASFANLDKFLKARLATFLDKKLEDLNIDDINKIRKTIFGLLQKAEMFYEKTLKALNSTYEFNVSYNYQSTTTNTALLDIVFDFSQPGVIDALQRVLNGQYDDVLVGQHAGVKINVGTLTHQIKRHTHIELNMPWRKKSLDHINESMARFDVVDNDGGRLYVLEAKDIVEEKNKRLSKLTVGGFLEVQLNQTRVHSEREITYAYTLRQVKKEMKRSEVQYQLKPYVNTYLQKAFTAGPGDFDEWVIDLDRQIDELDDNGKKIFGDTLLGLNLSLPAAVGAAWFKAQPKATNGPKVAAYLVMSRRLQRKLKEIIPYYYFADLENFANSQLACKTLLVYAAIPPRNSMSDQGGVLTATDKDYHWEFGDQTLRRRMVRWDQTTANLKLILERVHNVLLGAGMTGTAESFAPNQAEAIQEAVITADKPTTGNLWSLLLTESQIIDGALKTGYAMAEFTELSNAKPTEAVKALAEFGSHLTNTFNANVASIYGGGAIRPLGTALFIEAASTLDPAAGEAAAQTIAMLEVMILKRGAAFVMADYLKGEVPERKDVLIQERIVT